MKKIQDWLYDLYCKIQKFNHKNQKIIDQTGINRMQERKGQVLTWVGYGYDLEYLEVMEREEKGVHISYML